MSGLNQFELIDMKMSHLELVLKWRNQDFIRKVMYHDQVIDMESHRNWFNKIQENSHTIIKVFCYNQKPLGIMNISNIDNKNSKCEWGFYIGEKSTPKGFGKIMGYLSLDYIFNQLGIRKLCAEVMDFNTKSIFFHEKFGFQQEGILRKHVLKENQYVDVILMALFQEEWQKIRLQVLKQIEGMRI